MIIKYYCSNFKLIATFKGNCYSFSCNSYAKQLHNLLQQSRVFATKYVAIVI